MFVKNYSYYLNIMFRSVSYTNQLIKKQKIQTIYLTQKIVLAWITTIS